MKQKLRLMMTMLLLAVMGSAWAADEVTIASFSNSAHEGWTINNASYSTGSGGYYQLISSDASIVSPSISWSNYTDITITISARKYGGPNATQGKISVSQGDTELASYSPSGTSIVASGALSISPTNGSITISCPGASNSKGCGVQSIVIKGKNASGTFTVTYDANEGEGNVPVDSKQYNSGAIVTVLGSGSLSRDHYSFVNWNTSADGTGTPYSEGSTFTITANTVLYAQWSINSHNVSLPTADTYGTYSMSATNPVSYGTTVSLSYTPANGYENYTATWSVNGEVITGSSFTMPDEDVTVTVSVEKVTTTSMIVDFENSTSSYPDWVFTNISSKYSNSGVDAYGGSYYGANTNSAGNGLTSGSIRTVNKIENPQSLTCYITKQTNNTTESTWLIQVSQDGNTWTDVASQSAVSMGRGEWVEFSANLSEYSDVYVRVYYKGNSSTAIRLIDDLTLIVKSSSVATPTISLESGTYNTIQTANITCDTEGATIYYTTDGTDPTESSILYEGPITIGKNMTLKAIAILDDESSSIVSAEYVLKVATPVFSIEEGTYREAQTVTVTSTTSGATIYYTTDGSEPTTSSAEYSGAISVTETTTIKAIAVYSEMDNSDVATATYTIKDPLSGDVFVKATSESDLEEGMEIIIVNDTYNNVMGEQGSNNFGVATVEIDKSVTPYEAILEDDAATVLTLEGGLGAWYFKTENEKYLYAASSSSNHLKTQDEQNDNAKATIVFSGNNSDATIAFQGSHTHNIIMYNGTANGAGIFSCYTGTQKPVQIYYRAPQQTIAKPTITPATGTYTEPQTVTITNNAEGTTVYYTIDGTTPTSESTKYTTPFQFGKNGTYIVKAISIGADGNSRVSTSSITINIIVDAPVFTEEDGTSFTEPYTIHLTSAQGTTIYYTTGTASPIDENGNLTADAKVYNATTGIANLTKAITITAVAIDKGGNYSDPVSASYTYSGEVSVPYYENFDEGLGNFTTEPVNEGTKDVKWEFQTNNDVETYGEKRKYAFITGGTKNSMDSYVGEDRLISPVLDLTNYETVTMNFVHAGHWFGSSSTGVDTDDSETVKKASCHLQVRKVGDTEWTDISIPNWFVQKRENDKNMYERINSGDIDLSSYKGQKIQVCFYFTSTSETSGTWNVLKFAVTGTQEEEELNYETVNMKTDGYITYVVKNDIDWDATMKMNAGVYGYKVIQFTEAAKGGNGTTVLVELGNDEEMAVDEEKTETPLTDEQKKPLWSEKITPAGTPIILKGHAGDNKLVIAKSDDVIPSVKGNLLKPSFGDVQGSSAQTLYVLQKTSDWVATDPYNNYLFYKLANGRQIPDRKAYLNGADASKEIIYYLAEKPEADGPDDPASPHAKQNFIILSHTESEQLVSEDAGIPDGIETVSGDNETKDRVFYSISGVKVSNPTKGIYILNGKKVIVK